MVARRRKRRRTIKAPQAAVLAAKVLRALKIMKTVAYPSGPETVGPEVGGKWGGAAVAGLSSAALKVLSK